MNTNQFLQTARTVTFIIQKNKSDIHDYDSWYERNVLSRWGKDEIMQWAKESRNRIEKQGDLELNSSLYTKLIFSYLEEQDIHIDCSKEELLHYGIKKLVRLAQKRLPSGVSNAALVKVERRWVTASLPSWELLHALSYVYCRAYECCQLLGKHLTSPIDKSIPSMSGIDLFRENSRKVRYIKLRGMESHHMDSESIEVDRDFKISDYLKNIIRGREEGLSQVENLDDAIDFYSKMAESTFDAFGNHIPILVMFGENWKLIDTITTKFDDQSDKFIFWRLMAEKVKSQGAHGIIWVCESWRRDMKNRMHVPIRNMPIVGEELTVFGIDNKNSRRKVTWNIERDSEEKPLLSMAEKSEMQGELQFFLTPV